MIKGLGKEPSLAQILDLLQAYKDVLTGLDSTFDLEIAWLVSSGAVALRDKLRVLISAALPSQDVRTTILQAHRGTKEHTCFRF